MSASKSWRPVKAGAKEIKLSTSFGSRSISFSEEVAPLSFRSEEEVRDGEEDVEKNEVENENEKDISKSKGKSEEETDELTQSEKSQQLTDDITYSEKSGDETSDLSCKEQNGKTKSEPVDHSSSTEAIKPPELQSPELSAHKHHKTRTHRTTERALTISSGERKQSSKDKNHSLRSPRKSRPEGGSKIKKKTKKKRKNQGATSKKTSTENESPPVRENVTKKGKYRPTSQNNRHSRLLRCVKANKDFNGDEGELTGVHSGDVILLRGMPSAGWCEGECKGQVGWFPITIVDEFKDETKQESVRKSIFIYISLSLLNQN